MYVDDGDSSNGLFAAYAVNMLQSTREATVNSVLYKLVNNGKNVALSTSSDPSTWCQVGGWVNKWGIVWHTERQSHVPSSLTLHIFFACGDLVSTRFHHALLGYEA